jgi:hypothetical protein
MPRPEGEGQLTILRDLQFDWQMNRTAQYCTHVAEGRAVEHHLVVTERRRMRAQHIQWCTTWM